MVEAEVLRALNVGVPESATSLFGQAETFRTYTGTLDLVVEHYNLSVAHMLPEEAPLVMKRMIATNEALEEVRHCCVPLA